MQAAGISLAYPKQEIFYEARAGSRQSFDVDEN